MNIPRKVRISGADYEVVVKPGPVLVDGRQCCGSIEYEELRINIDSSFGAKARHCQTFLHEVLHGIARDRQLDFGDADEEVIVEAFARGLYQVLEDNPGIMRED